MPLNPDGTYTAGMPSTYDLIGGAQPQAPTSQRGIDVLRSGNRKERQQKQLPPPLPVQNFVEYVQSRARQDKIPSLANADDATFLNYAKDYAERVAPGALATRGVKVNKDVINTLNEHYRNKTFAELPQLRDYFRKQEEQLLQGPPAPEKPGMLRQGWEALKGAGNTALNVGQESFGTLARGIGEATQGTANLFDKLAGYNARAQLETDAAIKADLDRLAGRQPIDSPGNIQNRIEQAIESRPKATSITAPIYESQKRYAEGLNQTLDPEYKKAISPEAPFSATKGASFVGNTIANATPTLSAFLANPLAGIAIGSGQTGESVKNSVEDRVMNASPEELKNTPEFQNLLKTMSPEQAQSTLAKQAGDKAFMTAAGVGGLVSAATGGATSSLLQSGLKRAGINALLPRAAVTAGIEAPVQGGLNVLTQAAGNKAVNEALGKPDASSFEGAGQAFGEGAAAGAVLGPLGTLIHAAGNRLANQRAERSGIDVLRGKANTTPVEPQNLAQGQEQSVAPVEPQTTSQQAVPRGSDTTTPVNNSVITDPQVAEAVRLGLQEAPIPEKEKLLANPTIAQKYLSNYLNEAESLLVDRYDYTTEQFAQAKPALEAEWLRRAELKPEDLIPKPEKAAEEVATKPQATPEPLAETAPVHDELTKIVDQSTQTDTAPRVVAEDAVTPKATIEETIPQDKASKPIDVLKKKSEENAQNEPAFNAAQDISVEPTGRTVEQVRGALTEKIGEKAVAALEKSGVLRFAQSIKDIPEQYQREGISGVYTPERQAYLIADHITPGAEWRTLVHEVGAHYGLRTMLKPELYKQLENYIESNRIADTPEGKEIAAAWQSAEGAGTDPQIQTNETIAHMVQSRLAQTPGSIWNRAATAIRAFMFDKIGRYLPSGISKKLINNAVITQLAKSATGRAAKLRESDIASQQVNEGLDVPAYNADPANINETTAEHVAELTDLKSKPKVSKDDLNALTTGQKYSQAYFNDLNAFRFLNEKLYRQGVKVTPETDMFRAATVRQNKVSNAAVIANEEYVQPALNWMVTTSNRLGMDATKFANELKNFYMGKHALEFNEWFDLEKTKLTEKAEIERESLIEKYSKGEIKPGEYLEKLRDIVDKPDARVPGQERVNAAGFSDREARRMVNLARKSGITDEVVAEFEPQRKAMIEFINQNNLKSKKFSAQDEARRLALGMKWYVPFKGSSEANLSTGNSGSKLGAFTSEYSLAEGRGEGNVAQNPILSLMQDVIRSAENVADNEFLKVAFNNAMDYGAKTGVKVRRYDVEQAVQDKIKGEKLRKAYKDENTIIYDAGKSRYSITYPEGDPTLAAIKNMRKPMELPDWVNTLGKLTNSYGRLFVKFSPKFLLYKAIVNDITETTSKMFVDFGPKGAATYLGKFIKNLGPFGALSTYFKSPLKPRNLLERQQYALQKDAPKFAKRVEQLVKYGGDTSMNQMYSATRNIYKLHDELKRISKRGVIPKTVRALKAGSDILDALGDVSNGSSRVAALEAYESIMTKMESKRLGRELTPQEKEKIISDGALYSRKLLDFQQKSRSSVILNLVKPFTRVAINNSDRLISAIRNPDGSYNAKKAALMATIGAAMGVIYYTLLRESDPEKIKKQANETISGNLLIPDPTGGEPFKIPTSYGFGPLLMAPGMMMARIAYGDTDKREGASLLRDILMTNLSPFNLPQASYHQGAPEHLFDLMQGAAPWIADPAISLLRNKNSFGDAITTKFENKNKFKSDSGFASTPDQWKWAANTLRELTGMDVYPESLRYVSSEYGGAPMNEILRMMSIKDRSNKGQDIEVKNLPFLPSIRSSDAEYYSSRRLGEIQSDLEDHRKQLEHDNKKSKNPVDISKLHTPKLDLLRRINSMQRKNNDERKDVLSSKLPDKTKASRLDALRAKYNKDANAIINEANRMK